MPVWTFAYQRAVVFLALLTVGVLGIGVVRGETTIGSFLQLRESHVVLKRAVNDLKSENEILNEEINRLKESPGYARKVLRDKYHVTDEDEDILFFAE